MHPFTVVPILSLAYGSSIDPESIKEGADLYFECKIHANPWVYKVVWLHNVSTIEDRGWIPLRPRRLSLSVVVVAIAISPVSVYTHLHTLQTPLDVMCSQFPNNYSLILPYKTPKSPSHPCKIVLELE